MKLIVLRLNIDLYDLGKYGPLSLELELLRQLSEVVAKVYDSHEEFGLIHSLNLSHQSEVLKYI